jgi:hypothetical protein
LLHFVILGSDTVGEPPAQANTAPRVLTRQDTFGVLMPGTRQWDDQQDHHDLQVVTI